MRTIYLIDFENVHDDGFDGELSVDKDDVIHLFYTDNACRISLDVMKAIQHIHIYYHHCPKGAQALDMCLVAYLGMLMTGDQSQNDEFVIISRDKGYDNVIQFWKDVNSDVKISRRNHIGDVHDDAILYNEDSVDIEDIAEIVEVNATKRFSSQTRVSINNELQAKLSKDGYHRDIVGKTTSIVLKHLTAPNNKQLIWRLLVKEYGQKKGTDLYYCVKSVL